MVQERKKSLRAELRDRLKAMGDSTITTLSRRAADRLCSLEVFVTAQTIMVFLPLTHEVDAVPIATRAWQHAKAVAVPLVSYEQRRMIAVECRSMTEPMDVDRHGVRTPASRNPVPISQIDLVVVPGLAFDNAGRRLGRGGGFYDRFLSQRDFRGTTCGLGFDHQVVESVPTTETDVPLNMLVTDQRVLCFNGRE